jgi:hypothetical protein
VFPCINLILVIGAEQPRVEIISGHIPLPTDERGVEEDLTQQLVWEFRSGLIAHRDVDGARQLLPRWMGRKTVESKMNNATSWSSFHGFVPSSTGSFAGLCPVPLSEWLIDSQRYGSVSGLHTVASMTFKVQGTGKRAFISNMKGKANTPTIRVQSTICSTETRMLPTTLMLFLILSERGTP